MSLDQNLFTLIFTQNKDYPDVTDLVDPSGTVYYHKRRVRVAGAEYKIEVFDPMSESLLITATAPMVSSKVKSLELYNPTSVLELKYTGTISFKWGFKWEEHQFEWRREECFLIRKPDPPVLVAVTKEPSRNFKSSQVQILDYNLNRFDIDDRKGLEIIVLTSLMTFHDAKESQGDGASPAAAETPSAQFSLARMMSSSAASPGAGAAVAEVPPLPPPRPAPKTGLDRIVEMQAMGEDYNEITVEEEGTVNEYAQHCNTLLNDDAMLFISIKSSSAEFLTKVLQIVEETKRIRYKAGLDEDMDLHQYVLYDTEKQKGPRRINLNDDAGKMDKYKPPDSLVVHLSKIDMPELQPKSQAIDKGKKKDDKKVKPKNSLTPPTILASAKPPAPEQAPTSSNHKPQKNILTRTNRDKSPNHTQQPQPVAPRPASGLFNSRTVKPVPATNSSRSSRQPSPGFPAPTIAAPGLAGGNSGGGYETPGLSLYNSFMPHTTAHPMPGGFELPPTPPPLPPRSSNPSPPKPLTAAGVAQTVAGFFDIVKSHRR